MMRGAKSVLGKAQAAMSSFTRVLEGAKSARVGQEMSPPMAYCLLGAPGVGKGTYSNKLSEWLGVPHVSTGELVRAEIKRKTDFGRQMSDIVSRGGLLPDEMIMEVVLKRLAEGRQMGHVGFLLDGFPRTRAQAVALMEMADVQLALNLSLRESVLIEKCIGRRVCKKCGKNYNTADISIPAEDGKPEIVMPPLNPPAACAQYMETRQDDSEKVVKERLRMFVTWRTFEPAIIQMSVMWGDLVFSNDNKVYKEEAGPVEQVFEDANLLLNFEITGGIPETLPRLREALQPYLYHLEEKRAA